VVLQDTEGETDAALETCLAGWGVFLSLAGSATAEAARDAGTNLDDESVRFISLGETCWDAESPTGGPEAATRLADLDIGREGRLLSDLEKGAMGLPVPDGADRLSPLADATGAVEEAAFWKAGGTSV